MFSKANIVSTIVTAIWGYGGGFLLWGILGTELTAEHVIAENLMKEPPDMVYLILGCIIFAWAFSAIYGRWGSGDFGAGSGLRYGALMGIMLGLGEGLINFSTANMMNMTGTLINTVIYLVFLGIMGMLAGLVYNKMG